MPVTVRRAKPSDAAELVRLRAIMLEAMGTDTGPPGATWRIAAEVWFADRLQDTGRFAAFVASDSEAGIVAGAAGICEDRTPNPWNEAGMRGHLFNVATDPGWRRNGHASACVDALLGWFRDETGASVVGLHATGDGIEIYRRRGFGVPTYPELTLTL